MESILVKYRLKPGAIAKVEDWVQYTAKHRAEIVPLLAAEGVWVESVFLDSDPLHKYLLYYMRAESIEHALEVFRKSQNAHDLYHKEFMSSVADSSTRLQKLVDIDRIAE